MLRRWYDMGELVALSFRLGFGGRFPFGQRLGLSCGVVCLAGAQGLLCLGQHGSRLGSREMLVDLVHNLELAGHAGDAQHGGVAPSLASEFGDLSMLELHTAFGLVRQVLRVGLAGHGNGGPLLIEGEHPMLVRDDLGDLAGHGAHAALDVVGDEGTGVIADHVADSRVGLHHASDNAVHVVGGDDVHRPDAHVVIERLEGELLALIAPSPDVSVHDLVGESRQVLMCGSQFRHLDLLPLWVGVFACVAGPYLIT